MGGRVTQALSDLANDGGILRRPGRIYRGLGITNDAQAQIELRAPRFNPHPLVWERNIK